MIKQIKIKELINIDKIEEIDYKGFVYGISVKNDSSYCLSGNIITKNCDLPDIDLDFEDLRREKVLDYLKSKYGKDNVVNISTFSDMKAKASIREVSRVCDIPMSDVSVISKDLDRFDNEKLIDLEKESKELQKFFKKYSK